MLAVLTGTIEPCERWIDDVIATDVLAEISWVIGPRGWLDDAIAMDVLSELT